MLNKTNTKKGENMNKEKYNQIKITEEPVLNISVAVDKSVNGRYEERLNWSSFNHIDLVEVFQMNISKGSQKEDIIPLEVAERNALTFKRKLKAYIIEKADESELENFDWSEWELV